MLRIILAAALLSLALAAQATLLVPSTYPTIQSAINAAQNSDTVLVAPGIYQESFDFLGKGITVQSAQGAAVTEIHGDGLARAVTFGPTTTPGTIEGFTITSMAGGIYCEDSAPTILACTLTGNSASSQSPPSYMQNGSALLAGATSGSSIAPSVVSCIISGNASPSGVGVVYASTLPGSLPSTLTVTGCDVGNNNGRGLDVTGPDLHLIMTDTFVHGNKLAGVACETNTSMTAVSCRVSQNIGDGFYLHNTGPNTLLDCCIEGNSSQALEVGFVFYTSAIAMTSCRVSGSAHGIKGTCNSLTAVNCLISQNGTGIDLTATVSADLVNCTVAQNGPGGVTIDTPTGQINSCIIWGSHFAYGPPTVTYSAIENGYPGTGNVAIAPLFANSAASQYHLASSSPCRDAGDPAASLLLPLTDFDGTPRIVNGIVDMGADEIPLMPWPGSSEDIDLYVSTPGVTDPLQSYMTAQPGELMTVEFASPGGAFLGTIPVLVGQLFGTGSPPTNNTGLPYLHFDTGALYYVMYGNIEDPVFLQPGLPPQGVQLYYQIPPGLGGLGLSLRLQFFCATAFANNGFFAASDARDVEFL